MSYLRYTCMCVVFLRIVVSNILCFCFVCLRLVCPVLPVSLDCPILIAFRYSLTFIYSFSGLSYFDCPFGIL